jgi:hypothetical protein
MIKLTPTIVLQFQGTSSIREKYRIVLNNIVDIAKTITAKDELREAKLTLMEALAILKDTEERIWKRENGY